MKKTFHLIALILFMTHLTYGQIVSSNSLTPAQLVQQVLLGQGVTASNITFTGNALQIARFTATPSTSLGISNGILISTGNALTSSVDGPQGPNDNAGISTDVNGNADADLNTIIAPDVTQDAAALEFDFVPQSDTLKFKYIFSSDEYNEFVSGFNDVFAFLLSGPNPAGGNYVKTNVAIVPSSTLAVSIKNVNNGVKGNVAGMPDQSTGPCKNCAYYRDNYNSNVDIQFDGLTTVLTAVAAVNCGQTYHIKMVIADAVDGSVDSGVFLEGGSFSAAPPISLNTNNANSAITDTLFYEDCNSYCIKFIRNGNIALKDSFLLNVTGNAINGSDYAQVVGTSTTAVTWPSQLLFQANQDTFKICGIKALDDGLAEALDTIVFNISKYNPGSSTCITANYVKLKIYLSDYHAINISAKDSVICNSVAINLNASPTLGTPPYTYTWQPGNINTNTYSTPIITQPTTYTIVVNDICNKPITKQIVVTPSTLPVLSEIEPLKFCLDTVKQLPVTITGGKPSYQLSWFAPNNGIVPHDTINTTYYLQQSVTPSSGTYTLIVTDQCSRKDTIHFGITTVDCTIIVPNVVTPNGDNVNDVFKINGLENFANSTLTICNRWGKKVYSSSNYNNDWKPDNSAGVYFYMLEVSDGRQFNGFFHLIND